MKVCTDSCLFGAWIPIEGKQAILDIGAGTGLLSLMIAQRSPAPIDALEIDPEACQQVRENVLNSPWPKQIRILEGDFREYFGQKEAGSYDLIVCNPPFYHNHWKTSNTRVNTARHSENLQPEELVQGSAKLLQAEGELILLLPKHSKELYINLGLKKGLQVQKIVEIRNKPEGGTFRWFLGMKKRKEKIVCVQESTLFIREENGQYTPELKKYLSPYYLAL